MSVGRSAILVVLGILFFAEGTLQNSLCPPFGLRDCRPCDHATCPDHSGARCEARRCGTCIAAFFDEYGQPISSCCDSGKCADGSHKFNCAKNPCDDATCPGSTGTECRPNYCGGCKAEFYLIDSGIKLDDIACVVQEKCPDHLPLPLCIGGKCLGETCPLVPDAECYIDGCNGCHVIFYKGRQRLTREDCHGCHHNDRVPGCHNPCDGARCPGYPGARCEAQTCGTCKAIFYGQDREVVSCGHGNGLCPDGSRQFSCLVNPCKMHSCPGVSNSICKANYCGGCKAEFYYRHSGTRIPEYDCVPREQCPPDQPQAKCSLGMCDKKNCPLVPDADCTIDGCGGCTAIFFKGRKRLTHEDCHGCKPGTKMECGDPCRDAICPLYPEARCEARVCGECKAVFFGQDRKEIRDCCNAECPPDKPLHVCKINPCDTASCPAEKNAVCKPNYCGGCNAEFFIGNRKLTDIECVKNPDECAAFTTCIQPNCDCPAYDGAQCVIQYCEPNRCQPLFFDKNGKSLSYSDCGLCADGSKYINCGIVPQCLVAKCEAHPNAKCRSSNCGVCKVWFEDEHGNMVDCKVPEVKCKIPAPNPYVSVFPDAGTTVTVGETVTYKCPTGFYMKGKSQRRCIKRGHRGRLVGINPTCQEVEDNRCPNYQPGYPCQSDCRSSGECGYQRICCWNGCAHRCIYIPGLCPNGAPPVQCYTDPCDIRKCNHPEARCVSDYCGGCFAHFYVGDRKLTESECTSVPHCPVYGSTGGICIHQCYSDDQCGPAETCCFNGCGNVCAVY